MKWNNTRAPLSGQWLNYTRRWVLVRSKRRAFVCHQPAGFGNGGHSQNQVTMSNMSAKFQSNTWIMHTYRYQYKGPATDPVKWVSLQKGGAPIAETANTYIKCLSRVLQLPHDYAHSLHTQHLSYTYRVYFAKTAIRQEFCSGAAMRCVELVWQKRAFCGQREGG